MAKPKSERVPLSGAEARHKGWGRSQCPYAVRGRYPDTPDCNRWLREYDETNHSKDGVPYDGAEACRTGWKENACPWRKNDPTVSTLRQLWLARWSQASREMYEEHLEGCRQAGLELGVDQSASRLHRPGIEEERTVIFRPFSDETVRSIIETKKLDMSQLMGTFAPPPQPADLPPEIVAFHHWQDAKDAGFAPSGRHLLYGYLLAWWPGRDVRSLQGLSVARVTISGRVAESAHRNPASEAGHLVHALRAALRLEPRLWVEV